MVNMKKETIVFVGILALLAVLIILFLLNTGLSVALVILLLCIYGIQQSRSIIKFSEYERGVVLRMGKFNRVAGPGWVLIIPGLEEYFTVDLRTQTIDVPPQLVITKDSVELTIDTVIYLKVTEPKNAILNVKDYKSAITKFISAKLRSVVGNLTMTDVIEGINEINKNLQDALAEITKDWGIEIVKVEIQTVELPKPILEAMHEKKAAEQRKLAMEQKAMAKKITIEAINAAASKLSDPALAYIYMDTLKNIAEGKSNKIIFPLEFSKLAERLAGGTDSEKYKQIVEELLKAYKKTIVDVEDKSTKN